jgi:hypothetical protein
MEMMNSKYTFAEAASLQEWRRGWVSMASFLNQMINGGILARVNMANGHVVNVSLLLAHG